MNHHYSSARHGKWLAAVALTLASVACATAQAERPTAAHLFPESTVVYLRVTDATEFAKQMKQTSLGKIGEEEGIKAFVNDLYAAAKESYAEIEDRVGLSLDEILQLPQGEIAFGMIQPEEGRPQFAFLIDVGQYEVNARKLIEQGVETAKSEGATTSSEVFKEVKLNIVERNRNRNVTYFLKESTVVLSNSTEVCKQMLEAWSEVEEVDTLADNSNFATIMQRCSGEEGARPQLTWFVDPINVARTVARGGNAGVALAFIPATGLDGVRGMGGSAIMNTEKFEGVQHMHILIDTPRSGLVDALALTEGDIEPEGWVPPDVASYITMHWDFNETYLAIEKVYDSFTNEGQLHDLIENRVEDAIEVSFFEEILPALSGRVTMCSSIVKPPRWNSQANLIGVKLNDPAAFQKTLTKIGEKFPALKKERFGTTEYYTVDIPEGEGSPFGETLRRPEPSFCILGEYLLYTDSIQVLEDAIMTNSDESRSLAKEADYQRVIEQTKEQLGGKQPGLFAFSRPDKPLKMVYEMAQTEQTKSFIASAGEDNSFLARLAENMEQNQLPPFSVLSRHLAPTGAIMTNEDSGFHYMAFGLKAEEE